MFKLFLMTYTLFSGNVTYIPPTVLGTFDTMLACQQAAREADFENLKNANEIRIGYLCVNSGKEPTEGAKR